MNGSVYKCSLIGYQQIPSEQTVYGFHMAIVAGGTTPKAEATGLAAIINNFIVPALLPVHWNFWFASAINVYQVAVGYPANPLTPDVGPLYRFPFGLPTPGTGGINALPPQVAAVVAKRTQFAGKRNRGRNFFAAVPESFISTVSTPWGLLPAAIVAYQTAVVPWVSPLTVGPITAQMVIYSRPRKPVLLPPQARNIFEVTVDQVLRVQRRREYNVRLHRRKH